MGEIGIAEQPRALGAKLHHLGDDRLVVGRTVIVAAGDESAEDFLAQVAPGAELEEGQGARARQRDDVAGKAALPGFTFHGFAHERGQAGKFGLIGKLKREGLLVGEDVLAECGAERREALHDLDEARSRRGAERRAGTAEGHMIALQHALLFGVEIEPVGPAHERVDAAEQGFVGVDPVPVARQLRRNLALDLEQRGVAVRADEQVEGGAHAFQQPPAQLQGGDRVGEIRRVGLRRNGRDLGVVLGEGACVSLPEMLGLYAVERRHRVGGRPGLEEWVGGSIRIGHREVMPQAGAA